MIMKNDKRVVEVFKGNVEICMIKHGTDTVFNNTSEYVGPLPVTINSVRAENLKSYKFSGNIFQNGTPTPDAPIAVNGVGDLVESGEHAGQYDIPISSANTTTNIYLGEVQTTRKIGKLVLDGTENWERQAGLSVDYFRITNISAIPSQVFCTHYQSPEENIAYATTTTGIKMQQSTSYGVILACRPSLNMPGLADFKSYLAARYAAGTPITVWYVLANEETGIFNEPLMKIGDYADTVSNEQAGVQIPTNNGATVIDVDTTVPPASAYLKWKGYK